MADEPVAGEMLLGLNPYRSRGDDLIEIARVIASQISSAVANVTARERERRLADQIWTSSRDLIVVVDSNGTFRSVNPAWTRILGHAVEEVIGHPFSDFMHPDDIASSQDALATVLRDRQLNDYANRFRTSNGDYRRIEWHTNTQDGLAYAYGRDVTERQRAELALSQSQEQFRHLVQGVTDYAIYMLDLEGHVSSWNEGARRIKLYEPEEIIG
jgi:PAS domain S-box-containing protein